MRCGRVCSRIHQAGRLKDSLPKVGLAGGGGGKCGPIFALLTLARTPRTTFPESTPPFLLLPCILEGRVEPYQGRQDGGLTSRQSGVSAAILGGLRLQREVISASHTIQRALPIVEKAVQQGLRRRVLDHTTGLWSF